MAYPADVSSDPSCVLFYRLDDPAASVTFNDSGPNNLDATVVGSPTFEDDGPAGTSNDSTGFGAGIRGDIAANAAFDFTHTQPWSFGCWVKPTISATTNYTVFSTALETGTIRGLWIYLTKVLSTCEVALYYINNNGTGNLIRLNTATVTLLDNGAWHHIGITYNGNSLASGFKIYIDGNIQPIQVITNALSATTAGGGPAYIGSRGPTLTTNFAGNLDELVLFNEEKTGAEIADLMRGSRGTGPLDDSLPTTPQIILDTDYDSDIDDVMDLAFLLGLERAGDCNIAGIIATSEGEYTAGAIRAHLDYWGRGSIPLGQFKGTGPGGGNTFTQDMVTAHSQSPSFQVKADFPDALDVYRQALVDADDDSVIIVTSGTANSLSELLDSPADGISGLTGQQLVTAKVRRVVMVMGNHPVGANVSDFGAQETETRNVFDTCPVQIVMCPIRLGDAVVTGISVPSLEAANPMVTAWFEYYGGVSALGRPAWAQLGILFAVRGLGSDFSAPVSFGTAEITPTTKAAAWDYANDSNHGILGRPHAPSYYVSIIDALGVVDYTGESIPPTVSSASITSAGDGLTVRFSEAVTGNAGFTLSATGGAVTATYASGDGTSTLVYTLSRTIAPDETVTLSYTPGDVEDLSGNALEAITDRAVGNGGNPSGMLLLGVG